MRKIGRVIGRWSAGFVIGLLSMVIILNLLNYLQGHPV